MLLFDIGADVGAVVGRVIVVIIVCGPSIAVVIAAVVY